MNYIPAMKQKSICVRLPPGVLASIADAAARDQRSRNWIIKQVLAKAYGGDETGAKARSCEAATASNADAPWLNGGSGEHG